MRVRSAHEQRRQRGRSVLDGGAGALRRTKRHDRDALPRARPRGSALRRRARRPRQQRRARPPSRGAARGAWRARPASVGSNRPSTTTGTARARRGSAGRASPLRWRGARRWRRRRWRRTAPWARRETAPGRTRTRERQPTLSRKRRTTSAGSIVATPLAVANTRRTVSRARSSSAMRHELVGRVRLRDVARPEAPPRRCRRRRAAPPRSRRRGRCGARVAERSDERAERRAWRTTGCRQAPRALRARRDARRERAAARPRTASTSLPGGGRTDAVRRASSGMTLKATPPSSLAMFMHMPRKPAGPTLAAARPQSA